MAAMDIKHSVDNTIFSPTKCFTDSQFCAITVLQTAREATHTSNKAPFLFNDVYFDIRIITKHF